MTTPESEHDRVEVFRDAAGEHRWRFKAANGEVMADSAEGYANLTDALDGVRRVTGRTPAITQTKAAPLIGPGYITVVLHRG